jgi:hypothetical protein
MRYISATELAKIAKCERQLYLDTLYGENTKLTAKFIKKGNREHEQFKRLITGKRPNWMIRFLRWLLRLFIR